MDKQKIDKGLNSIQASLRSSGVEINENYLQLMRDKLSGEMDKDEFFQKIRENMKRK